MKTVLLTTFAVAFAATAVGAASAAPMPVDRAFVGKVSQGGMYEVEASKLAERKAVAQDVKDFATSEVHDHTLVGDKLKAISAQVGIPIDGKLNAEFSAKLARLDSLSGHAFDAAYMESMADIHAKDGAAFAKEATETGNRDYKAFAAETHTIVQRHIGAINGAAPPAK
jgi:putative membrane protein